MNKPAAWRILRRSEVCTIRNHFGEFRMSAFEMVRPTGGLETVIVISKGDLRKDVLLRINSACVTSEAFGDRGCDCAWQLAAAFKAIDAQGSGLVIYSPFEEGRGAGIFAKVNALAYSERTGASSSAGFQATGLLVDGRDFGYAPAILCALQVESVRILTNNPSKVGALTDFGIRVTQRIEIYADHRADLRNFFEDKEFKQGHLLDVTRVDSGRNRK